MKLVYRGFTLIYVGTHVALRATIHQSCRAQCLL